jgi:hypothetical protein
VLLASTHLAKIPESSNALKRRFSSPKSIGTEISPTRFHEEPYQSAQLAVTRGRFTFRATKLHMSRKLGKPIVLCVIEPSIGSFAHFRTRLYSGFLAMVL